jgi:hypothetical protein
MPYKITIYCHILPSIYTYNSKSQPHKFPRGKNRNRMCSTHTEALASLSDSQINQQLDVQLNHQICIQKDGRITLKKAYAQHKQSFEDNPGSSMTPASSAHAPQTLTPEQRQPATPGSGRKRKVCDIPRMCFAYANNIPSADHRHQSPGHHHHRHLPHVAVSTHLFPHMTHILCSCNAAAPPAPRAQDKTPRRRQRAPPREFHIFSVYAVLMSCRYWKPLFGACGGPKHAHGMS